MAGEAKTNAFLLASATVMIGAMGQLYNLNPTAHSIGLVKNFAISAAPAFTDLTQGVKNETVYSVMTGNPVQASMEVYEYTSKNLAYGLGLDGSALATITQSYSTAAQVVGNGTLATFTFAAGSDQSAQFAAGSFAYVQDPGNPDSVHVSKIASSSFSTGTQTVVLSQPLASGVTMPAGSKITIVNRIDVGSTIAQPHFAAKIVGVLPEGNEPITLLLPKIRITKGFNVAFQSGQFGNLPFEFKPLDLVPSDTFYADFVGKGPAALFARQ